VVNKLQRADCPSKYHLGSLQESKISTGRSVWHGEDAVELPLNHDDAQQSPPDSEEVTSWHKQCLSNSGSFSIRSEQTTESLNRYHLGTLIRRSLQRHDQRVAQALVTTVVVLVIKLLEDRISRRLFKEFNQ